jgi:hypothetical protein
MAQLKLSPFGEQAEQGEFQRPEGMDLENKMALRPERWAKRAEARAILEARARERYAAEQAKWREREEKARQRGRKSRGRPPQHTS